MGKLIDEPHRGFSINAELCSCISYAAWQNSVPLIMSLVVENASQKKIENVTLHLESDSGFLKKKRWVIDRILPGEELVINDRSVELDPAYLGGLNESEKSIASFSLFSNDSELASHQTEVRLLARDEWGGISAGGELVAAFVMPNDPAVAKILKSASNVLERHGRPSALDGYQSGDPQRVYLLVAAIWNAVCGLLLTYANPPKSFEVVGQKI